jgi:hypothetical protein
VSGGAGNPPNSWQYAKPNSGAGEFIGTKETTGLRRFPLLWRAFLSFNVCSTAMSAYYLCQDDNDIQETVRLARNSMGGKDKQLDVSSVKRSFRIFYISNF